MQMKMSVILQCTSFLRLTELTSADPAWLCVSSILRREVRTAGLPKCLQGNFWKRPHVQNRLPRFDVFLSFFLYYLRTVFLPCHFISGCGGEITLTSNNREVVITSPNFPGPYGKNLECSWMIKVGRQDPGRSTLCPKYRQKNWSVPGW